MSVKICMCMKQAVKDFYTENSKNRFESRGGEEDVVPEYLSMLDDFSDLLPNSALFLDCGCGVGRDIRYLLRETSFSVIGADISKEQLSYTKSDAPVVQSDMSKLPFNSDCFHGIWVPNAIFYLPTEDIKGTLTEFGRVLTEDGHIAIGFKVSDETERANLERWGMEAPYNRFTYDEAKQLVTQFQFSIDKEYLNEINDEEQFLTLFCRAEC